MPLNLATFKTRSLSAAVFVVVMLGGLLWNQWSFFILFSIIHFGCWSEYQKLLVKIDADYGDISPFHKYGVRIAGWCCMLYFTDDSFLLFGIRLHALGWWIGSLFVFILPIVELLFEGNIRLKNIGYSALGLLYISLSFGLLTDLSVYRSPSMEVQSLPLFALVVIACMWINDTMAYIVGSVLGKTPFSSISPKKTWEGTVGGVILTTVAIALIGSMVHRLQRLPVHQWAIIAVIASLMGVMGDLLESKLKRMAGVKDSGRMMPGHGGFLDRFDSLLLAVPFVWIYVAIVHP